VKIVIASGASGGHLFPGIAVADELKSIDKNCHILFVAPRKGLAKEILHKKGFPYTLLSVSSMPYGISFKVIPFLLRLIQSFLTSLFLLIKNRPHLVLGLGGSCSGPVVLCASLLRIPTVIHEQNVKPGRTSLMLARFVEAIAVSFSESQNFFRQKNKLIITDNPIRNSMTIIDKKKAIDRFNLNSEKFTILAIGGSQGASAINSAIVKMFEEITPTQRSAFQVIHISGEKDSQVLKDRFNDLGIRNCVYAFFDEMEYAYSACDVIVSRAGATTISEIILFSKPSILIPYPYAGGHQLANARYMSERNKAILLKEDKNLASNLQSNILSLYNKRMNKEDFTQMPRSPKNEAGKDLAELILNLKSDEKN